MARRVALTGEAWRVSSALSKAPPTMVPPAPTATTEPSGVETVTPWRSAAVLLTTDDQTPSEARRRTVPPEPTAMSVDWREATAWSSAVDPVDSGTQRRCAGSKRRAVPRAPTTTSGSPEVMA